MSTWNFESQNYKVNKKIHEELDSKAIINKILSIFINVVDNRGYGIDGATITIGDLTINSSKNQILIKNYPKEEATITVEKEGYKSISTDLILDALRQGHEFILELEDSEEDSKVESWPNSNVVLYDFESYADAEGTTQWGTGTVKTTGIKENGYIEIKVLANEPDQSFIDQKFYVLENAEADDDNLYELFTNTEGTSAGIYVKILTHDDNPVIPNVLYSFESFGDAEGTTSWGEGTVKTTGNKSNGYIEVEVVTNEPDSSFIGQKFYVSEEAAADDNKIYELFTDTNGTSSGIYVTISTYQESKPEEPEEPIGPNPDLETYNVIVHVAKNPPIAFSYDGIAQLTGNTINEYSEIVLFNLKEQTSEDILETPTPLYINFDIDNDTGEETHYLYTDTSGTIYNPGNSDRENDWATIRIIKSEPSGTTPQEYPIVGKITGGIISSEGFDAKIQPTGNSENGYTEVIISKSNASTFNPETYNPYYINFNLENDEGTEYHTVYSDTNGTKFTNSTVYDFQIKKSQ